VLKGDAGGKCLRKACIDTQKGGGRPARKKEKVLFSGPTVLTRGYLESMKRKGKKEH